MRGLKHATAAVSSTLQANEVPPPGASKVKVGVESLVSPEGPESIRVSGAEGSTVKLRTTCGPWAPNSEERTMKVCPPVASDPVVNVRRHGTDGSRSISQVD